MAAIDRSKVSKIAFACAVMALTIGVGIASASVSPSSGSQAAESRQATEAAITRANLPSELESALGGAFGGVWLEPETAQLHVGVTSREGHQRAEALAAQAGLAESVTETQVSSSWDQLKAAQSQWNQRLQGLLEAEQASTSLLPEQNSVKVELGSSVPASRRAALEQEAEAAAVRVLVETVPDQRLAATPWARCAKFVKFKAYCDPTLVSGVSIQNEVEVNGEGNCTAGPVVLNKKAITETLLLTAGHCLVGEGAVGKKWWAFEKQGPPKGKKEIGKAQVTMNKEAGADVGSIKIEQTNWAKAGATPLSPGIAPWNAAAETEPFPVIKQVAPVLNAQTCFSGQRSGVQCGKVVEANKTIGAWEEVFVVKLETGKGGAGDSGAPTFSEAAYKGKVSEGFVEGIVVGGPAEESETAYTQPLSFLLAKLKEKKAVEYELLTTANETRKHKFKAEAGSPAIRGTQAETAVLSAAGGTVECKEGLFKGMTTGTENTEVTMDSVTFGGCTFLGGPATVTMHGCQFRFHVAGESGAGTLDIVPNEGECKEKGMTIEVTGCKVTVFPQNGLSKVNYENNGKTGNEQEIVVTPEVEGIKYNAAGAFCLQTGEGLTNGSYTKGKTNVTGAPSTEFSGMVGIFYD